MLSQTLYEEFQNLYAAGGLCLDCSTFVAVFYQTNLKLLRWMFLGVYTKSLTASIGLAAPPRGRIL
jgi:hypothetical protein